MKTVANPVVARAEVLSPLSPVEAGDWIVATPVTSEGRPVRKVSNFPLYFWRVLIVLIAMTVLFLIIYH